VNAILAVVSGDLLIQTITSIIVKFLALSGKYKHYQRRIIQKNKKITSFNNQNKENIKPIRQYEPIAFFDKSQGK